ncbi:hypothetical protein [Blastococcus montanus]|uniref:hypothetical protein n=1 Tax=Blastococcus montanus TaxID=3144973 RepID=UPI0032096295
MSNTGNTAPVTAARAAEVAAEHGDEISQFLTVTTKGSPSAGKCSWRLVTLASLSDEERAAVAWLVADAIMRSRCGKSPVYDEWRAAVLSGTPASAAVQRRLLAFTRSVFGTTEKAGSDDHVQGHVAEWLWYLLMRERSDDPRRIVLFEPPKFSVTEPGPDGFIVYETDGAPLVFRLWELKKHAGAGKVDKTVRDAYGQLRTEGDRYLAQLTGIHSDKDGALGELIAQLVDLWEEADSRAGVGVGVTSGSPAPKRCFSTMGTQLKKFGAPGQLEGMLFTVEDYVDLAANVRKFVWNAL